MQEFCSIVAVGDTRLLVVFLFTGWSILTTTSRSFVLSLSLSVPWVHWFLSALSQDPVLQSYLPLRCSKLTQQAFFSTSVGGGEEKADVLWKAKQKYLPPMKQAPPEGARCEASLFPLLSSSTPTRIPSLNLLNNCSYSSAPSLLLTLLRTGRKLLVLTEGWLSNKWQRHVI